MSAYVILGTDSSGRPIRSSPEFAAVYDRVCEVLGFTPVTTQGGFMGDLAAELSGPTHDGDARDLRVWNLTDRQVEDTIRVLRAHGIAAWLRNVQHGGFTDPHIHAVPGRWAHPSPSALRQWDSLRAGHDGLASNGPDYHPYPLADQPPQEDDMSWNEELTRWYPGDEDKTDTLKAGAQLNQARGYAQEAYRAARRADIRTERIEKALTVLAASLGAKVETAVREALADAVVDVDVNVTGGSGSE